MPARPFAVKKQTGWAALKNVYRWGGQVFEVQIQTQANYWLEEWDLSRASHRTFEMQRRLLRRDLEERVAHYREFRRLLKAIFSERPRTSSEVPSWLELVD